MAGETHEPTHEPTPGKESWIPHPFEHDHPPGTSCDPACPANMQHGVYLLQEAVDHPSHYGGDTVYEVIKVCEAWGLDKDTYAFMVVRYVARAGKKDPAKELEDLKKAQFYLNRKIANMEAQSETTGDSEAAGYIGPT